jgi:hypothetical protein
MKYINEDAPNPIEGMGKALKQDTQMGADADGKYQLGASEECEE